MEIIRRETDYALRCLLYLGKQTPNELISVKTISEAENLPYELLRKVFQRMTKAGIVESIRGKQGGFRLAIDPEAITMRSVLDAVQGPVVVNRCVSDKQCCPNQKVCQFHQGICGLQDQITSLLEQATLQNFLLQDHS
ncbi:hypothetical protein BVX99_00265 [bacterium F16]|nr:hypothetical protein BVX99_00265 [bacterium F16]